MNAKVMRFYFLITLIVVSFIVAFFIFRPFLVVLILAAVFAVVLRPLYRGILRRMSGSPGLAAFATMIFSVVCILAPLTFITIQIAGDAQHLYTSLSDGGGKTYLTTVFQYTNNVVAQYAPSLALSGTDFSASVDQYIKSGLAWLVQNMGGVFGGATRLLLDLFIFLIALYYLLRDGAKLKQMIITVSPLADTDDERVFARLELAVNSVIRGSL